MVGRPPLYSNSIIYSEISIGFTFMEDIELAISKAGLQLLEIPKEVLFLAGKAYNQHRRNEA